MKKYTFLFAVAATLALAACGSGSATNESTDSVAAQVDTNAVSATDSNVAHIDTAAGGAKVEAPVK